MLAKVLERYKYYSSSYLDKIKSKFLIKIINKNNLQFKLRRKVVQFVNLSNLEQNISLKPKKQRRSKSTIYFLNPFAKKINEMLKIKSQGKAER